MRTCAAPPGRAGRDFEPIADAGGGGGEQGAAPSRFGLGSLINLAMLGSYAWQLGGGGTGQWSPATLVANLKHQNPIQLVLMASMLSSFLF